MSTQLLWHASSGEFSQLEGEGNTGFLHEQRMTIESVLRRLSEVTNSLPRAQSVCWASESSRAFDTRLNEMLVALISAHDALDAAAQATRMPPSHG